MFKFIDQDEDGLKFYETEDQRFEVIERTDGVFLLYELNEETDEYVYLGIKYYSLEECEKTVKNV